MADMQAELSRAGEYVGVVILTEDGVTVEFEDTVQRDEVERAFRKAGPYEPVAGSSQGEVHWQEFSQFGGRRWFEKVLRGLVPEGYTFETTKTDE